MSDGAASGDSLPLRPAAAHNAPMEPVLLLGGLVAGCLAVLGVAMRRAPRPSYRTAAPFRRAVPWVVGAMVVVAAGLTLVPGIPPVVMAGLVAYTGFAVTATWRMASLDRVSPWMVPARRRARLGFSILSLAWLGVVLGLLLGLADMVAGTPGGG